MNRLFLLFIFSLSIFTSTSQENDKTLITPIYQGCKCSPEPEICFQNKLLNIIDRKLTNGEDIKKYLKKIKNKKLILSTKLIFNADGSIFNYNVKSNSKKLNKKLGKKFNNLFKHLSDLEIDPNLLDKNKTLTLKYKLSFNISYIDYLKTYDLIPIKKEFTPLNVLFKDDVVEIEEDESEIPFSIIERVPVYISCDENLCNDEQKKCMQKQVSNHISRKFNLDLGADLNLSGIIRIISTFTINKNGDIVNIRIRAPHPELEEETIRVIKSIPKFKRPGFQRGKFVSVPYLLPIVFRVED